MILIALSRSELDAWARCPRRWYLNYYLGLVPATVVPHSHMQQGIRIHTALEGLHGFGLDPLVVMELLYKQAIADYPDHEPELRKEWDLSRVMVEGYLEWAQEESIGADLTVVDTEREIRVALPGVPGVELIGRFDQVVLWASDGLFYFRDWKSAASFERHELIHMDPQMRLYSVMQHLAAGVPVNGEPYPDFLPVVGGGIVTTLRRVKRSSSSRPPYYQQTPPFRYNPQVLLATLRRAQKLATEVMAARRGLQDGSVLPVQLFNDLQTYLLRPVPILHDCSWSCPFVNSLCPAMDDGSDWAGMAVSSGKYVQGDPYAHYEHGGIAGMRDLLAALS